MWDRLVRSASDLVAKDAARDEQEARARRVGAEAARGGGLGAGLTAWTRESTGTTRDGRVQMPRVACKACSNDYPERHDGRPYAHKRDGEYCPGGGAAL